MLINFPIYGAKREKIPISEIRLEIRKIEERFYGNIVTTMCLSSINAVLNQLINIPYGLIIKAKLIGNNVKLIGYNMDSKYVLDPNCGITHISKKRIKRN